MVIPVYWQIFVLKQVTVTYLCLLSARRGHRKLVVQRYRLLRVLLISVMIHQSHGLCLGGFSMEQLDNEIYKKLINSDLFIKGDNYEYFVMPILLINVAIRRYSVRHSDEKDKSASRSRLQVSLSLFIIYVYIFSTAMTAIRCRRLSRECHPARGDGYASDSSGTNRGNRTLIAV